MKYIVISLLALAVITSCKKNKIDKNKDDSHLSYFTNPDCWQVEDSAFYHYDTTVVLNSLEGGEANQYEIYWAQTQHKITFTYTGIGNYSSDDTDLHATQNYYDGLAYYVYDSDYSECTTCGGYMEILSDDGEYIEGNIRYLMARGEVFGSTTLHYSGLDCATFKLKWPE